MRKVYVEVEVEVRVKARSSPGRRAGAWRAVVVGRSPVLPTAKFSANPPASVRVQGVGIVAKVNRKTCKVEWWGFCLDRWGDRWLGYGRTVPISDIALTFAGPRPWAACSAN